MRSHGKRFAAPLIVVAGLAAYVNSFRGPFIFDDFGAIVENPTIRSLSTTVFSPPREQPTAGRPLVNLSFAVNYGLGGLAPSGYHAVNLTIHICCALLLFGIVRRTLELPRFREAFGAQSTPLGFVVALLWLLHPLNSEAVNYVSQRTESLMAFFFLSTMYSAIRAADSKTGLWSVWAFLACAAGMACKESMVTAPVSVVLYDLAFRFSSIGEAWRKRGRLYGALMSAWAVLAVLMWGAPRAETAGFSTSVSLPTYLLNQAVMLTHDLRLVVWPRGLVLNYGRPVELALADVVPQLLFILVLLGLSLYAWIRNRALGFAGLWVFLTLAPTTLVPIATEVGAERRMYLPLMAMVAVGVLVPLAVIRRLRGGLPGLASPRAMAVAGGVTVAAVSAVFASAVVARTAEYQSALTMSKTVLARWPSSVAEAMAGVSAGEAGLREEAIRHLEAAVAHGNTDANFPLAIELLEAGQTDRAIDRLQALLSGGSKIGVAMEIAARRALADAYFTRQDGDRASEQYARYLEKRPNDAEALDRLGRAQASLGRHAEAAATFQRLVTVKPGDAGSWLNLVTSLLRASDFAGAEQAARRSLLLTPDDARMLNLLGRALVAMNRLGDAEREFERALSIDPQYVPSQQSLAAVRRRGSRS